MKREARYVVIKFIDGDRSSIDVWQVRLKVDNQSFNVGPDYDTKAEAVWLRRRLIEALHTMVGEITGKE